MKVVFRVDASLVMGTGHVMRCLTLAHVLRENGANVEFICRKHEGSLIDKVRSSKFNVHELDVFKETEVANKLAYSHWLEATQQQDADCCADILKSNQIDWLIVDNYALDEDWHKILKLYCMKIMVIDDLADRQYQCDILLDQTFGRQKEDYSELIPKDCRLLLGSQYALLRSEFSKYRVYSLERRSKAKFKHLLINMGGVDIGNVTEDVINELKLCRLPNDINITILMGGAAPHLEGVKSKANKLPFKTEVKVDVENMAEIMANADIAIGAAGSTTWERCCLGLATIQIVTAKNQLFLAKMLEKYGAIRLVGKINEISQILENSDECLRSIGVVASQICDGMGVYKVVNKMTDCKILLEEFGEVELNNYINLSADDKALVLKMRNHPQIRKWMHCKEKISTKNHFEFIENLKNDICRRYFLVKKKDRVIGAINFTKIDFYGSVELGIFVNPLLQLKGDGMLLEASASHYAFIELNVKKIKLEVFLDNKRAIQFYKKCSFEFVDTKKINKKSIMHMGKIKPQRVNGE